MSLECCNPVGSSVDSINSTSDVQLGQNHDPSSETVIDVREDSASSESSIV